MRRLRHILLAVPILISLVASGQKPIFRRICNDINDNRLFWSNPHYPCNNFTFYLIWGRKGATGPYNLIDTVKTITSENFIHVNANIGPGGSDWQYFIERRDTCTAPFNHYSDTLRPDIDPTEQTSFDSISVDILTNTVYMGWTSNRSLDFNLYYIYRFTGTYTTLTGGGIRDTFYRDNTNNPSAGVLSYDINTTDSCGNPTLLGQSRHSTIFLEHNLDTCLREYRLSWSHYVGWIGIQKYYILSKSGTGQFQIIDSVDGTTNKYTGKYIPGLTYEIFVRAVKIFNQSITSSSNKIQFSTAPKNDPSFISINHISSLSPNAKNISFSFNAEPEKDVTSYVASIFDANMVLQESLVLQKSDIGKTISLPYSDNRNWFISVAAKDYCNNAFFLGDTSTNIVLVGSDTLTNRYLFWNKYFKWDTGVEKYLVSRGTGNDGTFQLSVLTQTTDSLLTDSQEVENVQNEGVCYYVEAIKQGNPNIVARSNMLCLSTTFSVYIPNAFVPGGINSLFRPEGTSIDYEKSTVVIYDRWGQEIYSGIIRKGWDGTDYSGQPCPLGVYRYKLEIISSENEKQQKSGTVTLLR